MAGIEIEQGMIRLSGAWTVSGAAGVDLLRFDWPRNAKVLIDASRIEAMDTAGALLFERVRRELLDAGKQVETVGINDRHAELLALVAANLPGIEPPAPAGRSPLEMIGAFCWNWLTNAAGMLSFLGEASVAVLSCVFRPARIRWTPFFRSLQYHGFNALPIAGLLSFLMGIVIAYQGAEQLSRYGANIFVVDLVGLSMLRELAPLLTAIIVAGRSGSAFTAEIGTMQVTEEIDALRTIGISPMDQLVLPKILALAIALPLLTVYADMMGVLGGMVMASIHLDVSFSDFLHRFGSNIRLSALLVGVGKTPVFAGIIAVVGCFQGFRVSGGAESVGRQTTQAVVQSIFLVIVADALFSVIFSMARL